MDDVVVIALSRKQKALHDDVRELMDARKGPSLIRQSTSNIAM
jgi:hypothetical protein